MSCFQFDTSGLALQTLLRHLPQGVAWIAWRMPGKVAYRLMQALAEAYDDMTEALCAMIAELDPRTTEHMITEWETAVSLPDPCLPKATTIEERRFWVQWRLDKRRYVTVADWEYLASLFGLTIVVTPGWLMQKPCLFDAPLDMRFDLYPKLGRFRVYINIVGARFKGFEYGDPAGVSEGFEYPFEGQPSQWDDFKCMIERIKPANVAIVWNAPIEQYGLCASLSFSDDFASEFC